MEQGIISRKEWSQGFINLNAGWKSTASSPLSLSPRGVVVHHTEPDNSFNQVEHHWCLARLRHWFIVHTQQRGWSDIGYHALICPHGVLFEGRVGGIAAPCQGAHAAGNNDRSLGIALMGNYDKQAPSHAALTTLSEVLRQVSEAYDIRLRSEMEWCRSDADGGRRNVMLRRLVGHRDLKPTICPGEILYRLLEKISAEL